MAVVLGGSVMVSVAWQMPAVYGGVEVLVWLALYG